MTINPRLMVVNSLSTNCVEQTQRVSLRLLNRKASKEFYHIFQISLDHDMKKVMDYVRENSIDYLSKPGSSFDHQRFHDFNGTGYSIGTVVTEDDAFNFGYVAPKVDTNVLNIVDLVVNSLDDEDELISSKLRSKTFIPDGYSMVNEENQIKIVTKEIENEVRHFSKNINSGIDCPYILDIFDDEKEIGIGAQVYVKPVNQILEFMTYLPKR